MVKSPRPQSPVLATRKSDAVACRLGAVRGGRRPIGMKPSTYNGAMMVAMQAIGRATESSSCAAMFAAMSPPPRPARTLPAMELHLAPDALETIAGIVAERLAAEGRPDGD
jgi:hypothetical protein